MDELFALPPSEFVAARDALAKRLRAAGDRDGAAAVKALRRPSIGAWAINQVAREQPGLVAAVVTAGAALRAGQAELLEHGDRRALRAATAARRDAVAAATKAAVALAGAAHRDAIAATFDAAATDEAAAEAVSAGRLTKELDAPSGFGLGGFTLPAAAEAEPDDEARREAEAAEAARRAQEAAERRERAEAEVAAARARRDDAAAELREAERRLAAAEAALDALP